MTRKRFIEKRSLGYELYGGSRINFMTVTAINRQSLVECIAKINRIFAALIIICILYFVMQYPYTVLDISYVP